MWDPTGEQMHDRLFYDWRWRQPSTGAIDFGDFEESTTPVRLNQVIHFSSPAATMARSAFRLNLPLGSAGMSALVAINQRVGIL